MSNVFKQHLINIFIVCNVSLAAQYLVEILNKAVICIAVPYRWKA